MAGGRNTSVQILHRHKTQRECARLLPALLHFSRKDIVNHGSCHLHFTHYTHTAPNHGVLPAAQCTQLLRCVFTLPYPDLSQSWGELRVLWSLNLLCPLCTLSLDRCLPLAAEDFKFAGVLVTAELVHPSQISASNV